MEKFWNSVSSTLNSINYQTVELPIVATTVNALVSGTVGDTTGDCNIEIENNNGTTLHALPCTDDMIAINTLYERGSRPEKAGKSQSQASNEHLSSSTSCALC